MAIYYAHCSNGYGNIWPHSAVISHLCVTQMSARIPLFTNTPINTPVSDTDSLFQEQERIQKYGLTFYYLHFFLKFPSLVLGCVQDPGRSSFVHCKQANSFGILPSSLPINVYTRFCPFPLYTDALFYLSSSVKTRPKYTNKEGTSFACGTASLV